MSQNTKLHCATAPCNSITVLVRYSIRFITLPTMAWHVGGVPLSAARTHITSTTLHNTTASPVVDTVDSHTEPQQSTFVDHQQTTCMSLPLTHLWDYRQLDTIQTYINGHQTCSSTKARTFAPSPHTQTTAH